MERARCGTGVVGGEWGKIEMKQKISARRAEIFCFIFKLFFVHWHSLAPGELARNTK